MTELKGIFEASEGTDIFYTRVFAGASFVSFLTGNYSLALILFLLGLGFKCYTTEAF